MPLLQWGWISRQAGGADLNVQIPRQAECKSHNIWLTGIICFHKQVGFEDLSRTANDFGNYLGEIIMDFKGECSEGEKGGCKVTCCSNPPWRLGRRTSKGAGFIDAIPINRISGGSTGKVPWTRDISSQRPENNTCVLLWAGQFLQAHTEVSLPLGCNKMRFKDASSWNHSGIWWVLGLFFFIFFSQNTKF